MMPGLPQSASQPGFAAFLANIGQAPASGTGMVRDRVIC